MGWWLEVLHVEPNQKTKVDNEENYYENVGAFVTEVLGNCSFPIICLVAAKSDLDLTKRKDFSFVADLAKKQVNYFTKQTTQETNVFLLDPVLVTSSKDIDKNSFNILDSFEQKDQYKSYGLPASQLAFASQRNGQQWKSRIGEV